MKAGSTNRSVDLEVKSTIELKHATAAVAIPPPIKIPMRRESSALVCGMEVLDLLFHN